MYAYVNTCKIFFVTLWFLTSLADIASLLCSWFLNRERRETAFLSGGCDSALVLKGPEFRLWLENSDPTCCVLYHPCRPKITWLGLQEFYFLKIVIEWGFVDINPCHIIKFNVIVHKSNWKNINNTFTNICKSMLNRHHVYKWFFGKVLSIGLHWVSPLKMDVREMWVAKAFFCSISLW